MNITIDIIEEIAFYILQENDSSDYFFDIEFGQILRGAYKTESALGPIPKISKPLMLEGMKLFIHRKIKKTADKEAFEKVLSRKDAITTFRFLIATKFPQYRSKWARYMEYQGNRMAMKWLQKNGFSISTGIKIR